MLVGIRHPISTLGRTWARRASIASLQRERLATAGDVDPGLRRRDDRRCDTGRGTGRDRYRPRPDLDDRALPRKLVLSGRPRPADGAVDGAVQIHPPEHGWIG